MKLLQRKTILECAGCTQVDFAHVFPTSYTVNFAGTILIFLPSNSAHIVHKQPQPDTHSPSSSFLLQEEQRGWKWLSFVESVRNPVHIHVLDHSQSRPIPRVGGAGGVWDPGTRSRLEYTKLISGNGRLVISRAILVRAYAHIA